MKRIILDPGHGGSFSLFGLLRTNKGAVGPNGLTENKVNLKISKLLSKELKGYKTYLTRHLDYFVDNKERVKFAVKNKGDIFLSIHCNAVPSNQDNVRGTEAFYWKDSRFAEKSKTIADRLCAKVSNTLNTRNLGAKQAEFTVIKNNDMPSVLLEVEFLSNKYAELMLSDKRSLHKIARSISEALDES